MRSLTQQEGALLSIICGDSRPIIVTHMDSDICPDMISNILVFVWPGLRL